VRPDLVSIAVRGSQNVNSTQKVTAAAGVVSAYVANHALSVGELTDLLEQVHAAFDRLDRPREEPQSAPVPAVSIKKSVSPDYIICLEDGKRFKSLRRHLKSAFGITPEEYRAKWGLPSTYPMVAPNYAAARSELARSSGLGRRRAETRATKTAAAAPSTPAAKAKTSAKKARRAKAS
jgi:predicted transcriptional regulator